MLNVGYTAEGYLNGGYLNREAQALVLPGIYVSGRYLSSEYTAEGYLARVSSSEIPFDQTGTSAELTISGFAGGIPWNQTGTPASVGLNTGWGGWAPDPGGILDNDTSDGGPLSYQVTDLVAGPVGSSGPVLVTYVGGAFTWNPGNVPEGFYGFEYQLYADGVAGDIGTVTIEYGDVFASVGVQGFAGTLDAGNDFTGQGTRASVVPSGFSGTITLTVDVQGTAASTTVTGQAGDLRVGQSLRGTDAEVTPQGFSGGLTGTFNDQGTAGSVTVTGNAGTVTVGTFFNEQGTAAELTVTGYAGTITVGGPFLGQGTGASVSTQGRAGFTINGLVIGGDIAEVSVFAFGGEIITDLPEVDRRRWIIESADVRRVTDNSDVRLIL